MNRKRHRQGELSIPPAALNDRNSTELLRVWINASAVDCRFRVGFWEEKFEVAETTGWGILLAGITGYAARALYGDIGLNPVLFIRGVREILDSKLSSLTDLDHRAEGESS